MESFLIAAKIVVPMAIMIGIGVLLRVSKVTDRPTMKNVDQIIYYLLMPVLMFYNIYETDFFAISGWGYIIYGLIALTVLMLICIFCVPLVETDSRIAAALGQAILRPNFILFGTAVATSLYGSGNIGIVMLMGAVAVPAFNAMSAIVLEAGRQGKTSPGKLLAAIVRNPMVIGAFAGIAVNLLGIRLPDMIVGVLKDLADITTPLSFLSMGVSLSIVAVAARKKPLIIGVVCRMLVVPLVFVTGGILLGYRGQELCSVLILFAAPTAVASYPMAVAMGADGDTAGAMVAFTTLLSLATIFAWTFALSSFHML